MYRVQMVAHHKTGNRWKVYPTYDFACPIGTPYRRGLHICRPQCGGRPFWC